MGQNRGLRGVGTIIRAKLARKAMKSRHGDPSLVLKAVEVGVLEKRLVEVVPKGAFAPLFGDGWPIA